MIRSFLTVIVVALAMAAASGCARPAGEAGPTPRQLVAPPQLADLSAELSKVRSQIDATEAALADLTRNPASDLGPQFERFTSAFDQTVADARRVQVLANGFRADGRETLRAWADQKAGKDAGDEAREALIEQYLGQQAAVTSSLDALRDSLTPHMQALYDTIGYLQAELTSQRVADIRPMAEESTLTAEVVKARIDVVLAELRALDVLPAPR